MNDPLTRIQVRSKIWLEIDGEPVFGQGREELLRLIEKTGSINGAAKEMGIPYRKAWTYIDSMEKRLGATLVTRTKGGSRGGKSLLSDLAKALLERYTALRTGFDAVVDRKFSQLSTTTEKRRAQ
jgi:molybdate transport system regulatory protein